MGKTDVVKPASVYDIISKLLPFESMELEFMQKALVGLLVLSPITSLMGVQAVNFRMAFLQMQ